MAATPTWPAIVEQQNTNYWYHSHSSDDMQNGIMPLENDLYLRLSQILECEIWNHRQTRADLYAEQGRRNELELVNQQQKDLLSQWQQAYQTVHASLEEHRTHNMHLKLETEKLAVELACLKREQSNDPFAGAAATSGLAQMAEAGFKEGHPSEIMSRESGNYGDTEEKSHAEFIRDTEEHVSNYGDGGIAVEGNP